MSIRYDAQGCIDLLRQFLIIALKKLSLEYLAEAKSHMLTPKGAESLHEGEAEEVANVITTAIVGGAWAAMDEWGTGSMMDYQNNPAFEKYMNSGLWNPARHDLARRGRPAGEYVNIFGETKTSKGKLAGVDLERLAREGKTSQKFLPTPPSHAMQTAARWLRINRVQTVIKEVLKSFPWKKFIITTKS